MKDNYEDARERMVTYFTNALLGGNDSPAGKEFTKGAVDELARLRAERDRLRDRLNYFERNFCCCEGSDGKPLNKCHECPR